MNSFQESWERMRLTYWRSTLCNRRKACKLIGFPGSSKNFTDWLREHEFISYDDFPHASLIEQKYMDYDLKSIYFEPQYDQSCNITNGSEYDIGTVRRYINVPLFTPLGVEYFKSLLADSELLKKKSSEIKTLNRENRIPVR